MVDPPNALDSSETSPGTDNGPGLSCFWPPTTGRLSRFLRSLLAPAEQDRLVALFYGPQWPQAPDRRLLALGLARRTLGKVVLSSAAWKVALRARFEIRRGSDARRLASVAMLEAETPAEALAVGWSMAQKDVGPRWHARLVLETAQDCWTIFLPPPRTWPGFAIRPYILSLQKLPH